MKHNLHMSIAIDFSSPDIRVRFVGEDGTVRWDFNLTERLGSGRVQEIRKELTCDYKAFDRFVKVLWEEFERWLAKECPGLLSVDNSSLYQSLRLAVAEGFSTPEGERWPQADLTTPSRKLKAVAQLKPDPVEVELTDSALVEWQERMAEDVMSMDDQTADVLDIISAVWLEQANHPEDMVNITADDFLHHRGLKLKKGGAGRRGGYHDSLRQEIAKNIGVLHNTWIRVFERDVTELAQGKKGPYRKRAKWAGESRALVVSSRLGQTTPAGGLDAYAWRIRPGDVFTKFLLGPGPQTALISRKALRYDPYRQKWEKRLTRYLAYIWRIRGGRGDYSAPVAVQRLLQGIGGKVNESKPKRTKVRMEKALDQLQRDGVIASWRYESGDAGTMGQRGWWREWLTWKVLIQPPRAIIDHYAQIQLPMPGRKALPVPTGEPVVGL